MKHAYIVDAIRTPFGRYAGGLAPVRADDLGAIPIAALIERNPSVNWAQVDDVIYGCANQAGEDNRNVGRMSALRQACRSKYRQRRSTACVAHLWMQSPWQHVRSKQAKPI